MKAAIYNPYWDTLGGGERYTISFAKVLTQQGYSVDVEWKSTDLLDKIHERFGIETGDIKIVPDVKKGDGYDLCFWVSDGSIPLLHSRNNLIHFQVPFTDVNGRSLINKMKLFRIKNVICNSQFTKNIIDTEYGVNSVIIYPPCDVDKIKAKRKENIILAVGRFSNLLQAKRQDVLIDAFIRFSKEDEHGWKLILAGGTNVGATDFIDKLKLKAKGHEIEFIESPDFRDLITLYGKAKLFWSASGYSENPIKHPKKMEHFGISLVEAMAAGCIPFVFKGGGYREILKDNPNYLWDRKSELVSKTLDVIKNKGLREATREVRTRAQDFGYENFKKSVIALI